MKLETPNWKRELWIGDNLPILRGMNSETVDLIYLDPPFNSRRIYKGKPDSAAAGQAFSDIWHDELITEDDRRILRNRHPHCEKLIAVLAESHGREWQAYLSYIGIRLMEMHRILRETGSIYLHCDPKMSHPLKMIMDIIFGQANFRNEIVWHYSAGHSPKQDFKKKHDLVFRYAKSASLFFNQPRMPYAEKDKYRFTYTDDDGREYRINHIRGMDGEYKRFYWDEGTVCDDVWSYLRDKAFNQVGSTSKERTGWATQKPVVLLERIVKASSDEGDIVMDPFCGCATA